MCYSYKFCLLFLNIQLLWAAIPPPLPRDSILTPSSTLQHYDGIQDSHVPTPAPRFETRNGSTNRGANLKPRVITSETSTCGYYNGDPTKPRTANDGFDCRIDSTHGLWGFCPITVINAVDCGLAGACVDRAGCSTGCGVTGNPTMTTFTCSESNANFCSTVLLGQLDQTFSYIACGAQAKTDILIASPTADGVATGTTLTTDRSGTADNPTSLIPSTTSGSSALSSSATWATTAVVSFHVTTSSALPSSDPSENNTTSTNSVGEATSPPSNTGAIIGGAIGGLTLICITVIGVVFIIRRGIKRRLESSDTPAESIDKASNKEQNKFNASIISSEYKTNDIQKHPVEIYTEKVDVDSTLRSLPSRGVPELPSREARFELG